MKNLISVEGHSNLFRDETTGAIVNCDSASYEQYLNASKNRAKVKDEIKKLQDDMNEIKFLLKELINESRKDWITRY